jgi:hypothetical protein
MNIYPMSLPARRLVSGFLLGAAVLLGSPKIVLAHEGHDHGGPAAAPLPTQALSSKFVAVSGDFEVVGVLSRDALTLYLDETRTNQPIDGATLEIAAEGLTGKAEREAPGTYRLALKSPLPVGTYALTLSIDAAQGSDLLTAKLDVAKPAVAADAVAPSTRFTWKVLAGSALLLVVVATALLLLKRQRASRRRSEI